MLVCGFEKACARLCRAGRGDGQVGISVDVPHLRQLVGFVFIRVLYNAQSIYPKIFDAETVCHLSRIADCLPENADIDSMHGIVAHITFVVQYGCTSPQT
jgi:hypothetical protein